MSWRGANALYVARKLGLVSGLKLVLDAGDAASAPSSPTKWLDLSGNGYDFELGADSTHPGTDEPTLNGTPGQLAAGNYFGFDGGDYLTYDAANETWMQKLHKDNALFSVLVWASLANANTVSSGIFGNLGAATNTGVFFRSLTSGYQFVVRNAGVIGLTASNILSPPANDTWRCIGLTVDEGAASGAVFDNGAVGTFASSYASPAAGDASFTFQIGSDGNATIPMSAGGKTAMFMAWEGRALTAGEMQAFFNATRGRYGI